MTPSRTPIRLYWQMVDHFQQTPGDWRLLSTRWQVECVLPTKSQLALLAIITAGTGTAGATNCWGTSH